MHLPKVIAHRGASQIAPENTLIAFETAHQLGATWVEFDVMIMQCGTLIVHHDDTFARILGLDKNVHATTYAQIKDCDAGSWFDKKYADVRIPTLAQTLACCARLGLSINLEFKTTDEFAEQTAQHTLAMLRDFPYFTPEHVLLTSVSTRALLTAQRIVPEYKLGLVADNWTDVNSALALPLKLYSLSLHYPLCDTAPMAELRALYQIAAFTVNDPQIAQRLFAAGAASVFSDNPQLLS